MKSITKSLKDIAVLTISLTLAFILALAANFAYGEWSNPPLSPPTSNVPAPLNEGWDLQIKSGRLGAQHLNAFNVSAIDTMRAPEYCDEFGANCVNAAQLYNLVNAAPAAASGCAATGGYYNGYNSAVPALNHLENHVTASGGGSCSANTHTLYQCIDGIVKTIATWETEPDTCGG